MTAKSSINPYRNLSLHDMIETIRDLWDLIYSEATQPEPDLKTIDKYSTERSKLLKELLKHSSDNDIEEGAREVMQQLNMCEDTIRLSGDSIPLVLQIIYKVLKLDIALLAKSSIAREVFEGTR